MSNNSTSASDIILIIILLCVMIFSAVDGITGVVFTENVVVIDKAREACGIADNFPCHYFFVNLEDQCLAVRTDLESFNLNEVGAEIVINCRKNILSKRPRCFAKQEMIQ
jgi:hypothetical protein